MVIGLKKKKIGQPVAARKKRGKVQLRKTGEMQTQKLDVKSTVLGMSSEACDLMCDSTDLHSIYSSLSPRIRLSLSPPTSLPLSPPPAPPVAPIGWSQKGETGAENR